MDIKDLNKPQLILLALLLSFVTSIATGITTVTLMEQAPASVTVPINRVIKQTIEKIEQVEGKTTVQTVIVKEEDLIVDAIAKNKSSGFVITKEVLDAQNAINEVSAGRGFALTSDGVVVVDATLALDKEVYYVRNDSGKFKAEFLGTDKSGVSYLKLGAPLDPKNKIAYTVPAWGDLAKMNIGQKIIVLGNGISSFMYEGNKDLRISVTKSNAGSMVLNLDGEVLGIALTGESSSFAPIDVISLGLKSVSAIPTP